MVWFLGCRFLPAGQGNIFVMGQWDVPSRKPYLKCTVANRAWLKTPSVCQSFQFFKIHFVTFGKRHLFKDVITKKFYFCFEYWRRWFSNFTVSFLSGMMKWYNIIVREIFITPIANLSSGRYATKYYCF